MGLSSKYLIEDHFGNHLGRVGVSKINGKQVFVEDGDGNKILFTQGFVEWSFIIRGKRNKKIAVGTTSAMMLSKNTHGILHAKPSFILSIKPHHPDSRFLLAIFVILLKKMSRIDISKYYLKLGPALQL
ncbi:MAG: hypothetical protein OEM77_01600 [Nitrosopumilus sp.]|nr:hypothetical protein [Nitrosopumilus sp.]MDH3736201.1 hypothetical protein [Nitrosopumilus sp.]